MVCLAQRVVELIGSSRGTTEGPPGLRRTGCGFVRRTQCNQVLRVECAKRGRDTRPDSYDAFLHVWAKQCDPKIAAKEELGAAHCRWASRMGRAIILHLFNDRCRVIHDAAPTGGLIVFVHLRLTTRASGRVDVNFLAVASAQIGFSPIKESTVRPIVRVVDGNVISEAMALTTAVRLSDNEQVEVLRRLDQFRAWHSLDDKRYCLVCGKLITGRQIRVTGGTRGNGPLRLNCPTEGCNSIPMDWVLPTDEILAKVEKMAAEERKASAIKTAAVTIGNGKTAHTDKSHEDFVSRLRRLAFHLRRHSKAVPSNPCGP
jgi:hypothetical protein